MTTQQTRGTKTTGQVTSSPAAWQLATPTAQSSSRFAYNWVVTLVVIFGAFMSILDQTIVNIAIPRLQTAFGANLNRVQWVLTAYILTQGVVTPTTAFFADRFGTKHFYIIALTVFTAGSALCGLAWSLIPKDVCPCVWFLRQEQGSL